MTGTTETIARFTAETTYDSIPDVGIRRAVDAMTDGAGVALAGSRDPMVAILRDTLDASGADGGSATVIGSSRGAGLLDAALINGTMTHAIDYDDTAHPSYSHPTSHLLPALLALGEQRGKSGRVLVTAYSVGLEVEGKLGRSMNFGHYARGWHATGTFGTIATAAACANLLGLSVPTTQRALGVAASCAAGLRANFGTMTKPLHAGNAARNGLYAVLLAERGYTASPTVFEDRSGYFALFGGDTEIDAAMFERLGEPWEVLSEIGLALKAYPSCGATHPAIEAASILAEDIDGAEIETVRVGVTAQAPQILVYDSPDSALHGKFSMQYCIAAALLNGTVDRQTFTEGLLRDERLQSLMPRVRMEVDDRVRTSTEFAAVVEVTLRDGSSREQRIDLAKGKPERWLSKEDLRRKFDDCSGDVFGDDARKSAFDLLQDVVNVSDVGDIATALSAPGR